MLQQYDNTSVSLSTSHLENVPSEFVGKLKRKIDFLYILLPLRLAFNQNLEGPKLANMIAKSPPWSSKMMPT
ncbi:hypothetical protein TNCV_624131 [Trichonephila clavipes]|nr:hypothetical protein TNCV_624131 [Trichonephila clavipes]